MQNCLGEMNLTYCLIYLNDIIIFLQMVEEHLHHLHIIFDQFREHNLKLKPSKCDFFRNEITCLAHQVSKDGVCPSNLNLKAITECIPPQIYTKLHGFLSLMSHYRRFIKGLHVSHSPLVSISLERGLARSQSRCHSLRMPWGLWGIETGMYDSPHPGVHWLHQAIPVGDWCIQRCIGGSVVTEAGRQAVPPCCLIRALMPHEKNYHSTKLRFLALKWAVTEHFKEYLPYQSLSFVV